MKKEKIIIIVLAIIILLLSVICVSLKVKNNHYKRMLNGEYDADIIKLDYTGIYQTEYYNEFGKSMTLTIRLDENNYCSFQDIVTGRTTSTSTTKNCTYVIENKKLTMTYKVYDDNGNLTNTIIREGEFLDNNTLFYGNKRVYKIS